LFEEINGNSAVREVLKQPETAAARTGGQFRGNGAMTE
jgi:hypothetical protein